METRRQLVRPTDAALRAAAVRLVTDQGSETLLVRAAVGLPIGVAVCAPAAVRACAGRIHVTDRTGDGRVFAAPADSSVELDPARVRSCHLVRSTAADGPTSARELADEDACRAAISTPLAIVGEDAHTAWEHRAASLPDARPGRRPRTSHLPRPSSPSSLTLCRK
ncbi:hypothetical protein [Streptomyces sp. NPDC003635]